MASPGDDEVILEEGYMTEGSISSESEGSGADCASRIRFKPIKDIWPTEEIIAGLRKLPGGGEAADLTCSGKAESLIKYSGSVLWSCWLGRPILLQKLLAAGLSPHITDGTGRTGMHLAALVGNSECLQILLRKGVNVNQWDKEQRVTPLHCAASAKSLQCIRILLVNGADANAGINKRSPLHYAVQSDSPECVQELLNGGACPDTPQVYTETPLHVAASGGFTTCLQLLLKHGADARAKLGVARTTALHMAAEEGHTDCVGVLLDKGALIDAPNSKNQTSLHLASKAQASDTLELLICRGASTQAYDADGRTPLHGALGRASRSSDCVRILLAAGADANQPDNFGYTPMHLAALNEFSSCVCLLLDHGGDVTLRTKGGQTVLSFIVRRTPEVIPKYLSKFDDAIKVADHEIGDVDCELKLDFRPLVPAVSRGEAALLLAFIEVGRRDVLKHPLCETFLYLKWRRIRKFFLASLTYHIIFVILYSIYIIGVFIRNCPSIRSKSKCGVPLHIEIVGYLLICLNFMLLGKEIFQMLHDFIGYIKRWENWLQLLIILSLFLCAMPGSERDVREDVHDWQHHIAAISIFLAWLELMIIVGRFPMFGLYVQMFTTVAVNFSKFLMAYSCLLIAFGLSFGVLFANYPSFNNVVLGLLKTVIMMSGELEFEDMFYNNVKLLYPVTTHILFLAFVLLVTVILTNLLVGLAVSDIQALQESAGLDRLVRQAELVARLESMLFSPLLHCAPPRVLAMMLKSALLLASRYRWALCIRPNDPREKRIPKELISSVYKLVASKKEQPKHPKNNKYNLEISSHRLSSINAMNIGRYQSNVKKPSTIRPRTISDLTNINKPNIIKPLFAEMKHPLLESETKNIANKLDELSLKLEQLYNMVEGIQQKQTKK
ncbi:transient receptor potential channel pyrexia-like [Arctopsyche grandis]|uniref:transient receptor potential channel pyrexia-like n=1 Tax=Arctopsyche grandis TaxID=121162 RepID=UPI00406DA040